MSTSSDGVLVKRNVKTNLRRANAGVGPMKSRYSRSQSSTNIIEDSHAESTHSVYIPLMDKNINKSWIATTFFKKECARYVPKTGDNDKKCCCGRLRNEHIQEAIPMCTGSAQTTSDQKIAVQPQGDSLSVQSELNLNAWDKHQDVKEFPTDAFGKIEFLTELESSSRVAHYVRISNDTHPKHTLNLLSKHWKMPIPHLAISVAGGTKNFILNKQDQDTFNRGLVKAAQTVGAWIISTGVNCGVHKAVGEAVKEGQAMRWISNKSQTRTPILCLGVAPWGYVENWQSLVGKQGEGLYPAQYKVNPIVQRGKPVSLNPYHTHFLLIDDGTRMPGCDVPYRAKLEQIIRAQKFIQNQLEPGLGIPVVKVCLEGGSDTILSTKEAVLLDTPVVVCEGTGRAADLLAFANRNCDVIDGVRKIKSSVQSTIYERIHTVCKISKDHHTIPELKEAIDIIMKHESMITIFRMDAGEQDDLDLAILKALLKGQTASPKSQLKLALSWGRVDVAESIFSDHNDWPLGSLDNFVTQALTENRVDFLELFLEKGAIMKEYLTVSRLRYLYNKAAETNKFIRKLIVDKTRGGSLLCVCIITRIMCKTFKSFYFLQLANIFYLHHVRKLIQSLMGEHEAPLYNHDRNMGDVGLECKALVAMSTCLSGLMLPYVAQVEFLNIKSNNEQLSIGENFSVAELVNPGMHFPRPFRELFLWAVLVSRMDLAEFLWERGEDPVCLAIVASRMLRSMSKSAQDPDDKLKLLENSRKFEKLAICVIDECYITDEDLAQMMITIPHKQWGGMNTLTIAAESEAEEFISRPCPQAVIQNIWMDGMRCSTGKAFFVLLIPLLLKVIPYRKDFVSKTMQEKVWMFYNAPVTKFFGGLITYLMLLLLFSYVLLFDFQEKPSVHESILFVWICTLIIEEFRQLLIPNEFETWYQNVRLWKRSVWNWIEALMLSLASLGYCLHWSLDWIDGAKCCYSASCFLFYVRLLRMYAVNTNLGPKMVMIRKMIHELVFFLCILLVFMVGYGVASQSLLFPNQTNVPAAITRIFYMPYFQILGELFLDTLIAEILFSTCCDDPNQDLQPCPKKHIFVSVLFGIYLLIGNVLLLNLLIAIFSFVFDEVQSKALQIWRYERYALVMEYADRPAIPAPFVIFQHLFMILSWLYRVINISCSKADEKDILYNLEKKIELRVFEKECAASYRRKKANIESSQVTEKVDRIEKKLEESIKQYEEKEFPNNEVQSKVGRLLYPHDKASTSSLIDVEFDEFDSALNHSKKKRQKFKQSNEHNDPECSSLEHLTSKELDGSDIEQASLTFDDSMEQTSLSKLQVIARQQATAFMDLKRGIDHQMQLVQARLLKLEEESQGNKHMLEENKNMLERMEHMLGKVFE
ncbi:transient receptor potential cation channel subfamily M member 3-like [Antedon mediterranea]|uniref:transient receptor potential cation channel subfamily M member 3-like n=1 Tax=Antedon mediterranea TaxID=105859 RepID=UPI003AF8F093